MVVRGLKVQMRYKYIKSFNGYKLTLNAICEGFKYKEGWLIIKPENGINKIMYREECFELVTDYGL